MSGRRAGCRRRPEGCGAERSRGRAMSGLEFLPQGSKRVNLPSCSYRRTLFTVVNRSIAYPPTASSRPAAPTTALGDHRARTPHPHPHRPAPASTPTTAPRPRRRDRVRRRRGGRRDRLRRLGGPRLPPRRSGRCRRLGLDHRHRHRVGARAARGLRRLLTRGEFAVQQRLLGHGLRRLSQGSGTDRAHPHRRELGRRDLLDLDRRGEPVLVGGHHHAGLAHQPRLRDRGHRLEGRPGRQPQAVRHRPGPPTRRRTPSRSSAPRWTRSRSATSRTTTTPATRRSSPTSRATSRRSAMPCPVSRSSARTPATTSRRSSPPSPRTRRPPRTSRC